jgi:hypothetical protein
VNSDGALEPFDPNIPAALLPTNTPYGPSSHGTFASEFGCSVFSSFESMAPTLSPTDWAPHAAPMVQRNYACDSIVYMYFGPHDFSPVVGSQGLLQTATFLCMLGQALEMQADILTRRSGNAFGTLTWQINEIWPTGGWGSLEYGTVGYTEGQVLGGRWKPLHHFMASHLYNDVVFTCGDDARCYVKNDNALAALSGTLSISALSTTTGRATRLYAGPVALARGAGSVTWLCADGNGSPASGCAPYSAILPTVGCAANGTDCVLQLAVTDDAGAVVDASTVLLSTPGAIAAAGALRPANVTVVVSTAVDAQGDVPVYVTVDAVSLFVTLTTLAQGRFRSNAVVLLPGTTVFPFVPSPYLALDLDLLASTTRAEHVASYVR